MRRFCTVRSYASLVLALGLVFSGIARAVSASDCGFEPSRRQQSVRPLGDHATLVSIGKEIGLPEEEIKSALVSESYAEKVKNDIREAAEIGVQGVPFFVFDRKYAVSGAQPPEYFLQALNQSFGEWKKANPVTELAPAEGAVCNPDGDCS